MPLTPPLPETNGKISEKLTSLADEVWIESAKLTSVYSPQILNSIKELLRITNSYYSNLIESEGTHPIDIERAMRKNFDKDEHKKNLQQLSLIYIDIQKEIETECDNKTCSPFSKSFVKKVHNNLYSKEEMKPFLNLKNEKTEKIITMVPGELRKIDVEVGKHIAPHFKELPHLFNTYENFYNKDLSKTSNARKLISAITAHHKLIWLHPFPDGNGRTSRLILDAQFYHIGLEGYGLWNISRGLARNKGKEYKKHLALADQPRQGDRDGRGQLSQKNLEQYVEYMLTISLDQIKFMHNLLNLQQLSTRINTYIALSQNGMYKDTLPKYSDLLLKELLLKGQIARGEVEKIIHKGRTTAAKLTSELSDLGYIESDTPKGAIRLKFNSYFSSKIFPDLIPETD